MPLLNRTLCCLSTPHKDPVTKLALSVNVVMPNTGIEPATLRPLARSFNQLSFAAALQMNGLAAFSCYETDDQQLTYKGKSSRVISSMYGS